MNRWLNAVLTWGLLTCFPISVPSQVILSAFQLDRERRQRGAGCLSLKREPSKPSGFSAGILMARDAVISFSFKGSENTCRGCVCVCVCVCVFGGFGSGWVACLFTFFGVFLKVSTLSHNIHSLQDNEAISQTSNLPKWSHSKSILTFHFDTKSWCRDKIGRLRYPWTDVAREDRLQDSWVVVVSPTIFSQWEMELWMMILRRTYPQFIHSAPIFIIDSVFAWEAMKRL